MLAVRTEEEQLSFLSLKFTYYSVAERLLACAILFYSAFFLMLPVPLNESIVYPWWARRVAFGNVILFEVLFVIWIGVFGWGYLARSFLNGRGFIRLSAVLLVVLAIWCGIVSILSPLPALDFGRSVRLLIMSCLLLATVRWSRQMGETALAVLVFGFLIGTAVNLLMTFQFPFIVNGIARLSGQNTPGVAAAISIHLSAFLFFHTRIRVLQVMALAAACVCAYACAISFSRTGWIIGVLGLLAWLYIVLFSFRQRSSRGLNLRNCLLFWLGMPITLAFAAAFFLCTHFQAFPDLIGSLIKGKEWFSGESNKFRVAYFVGVAEILVRNPFGVGYSGFFYAMQETSVYRSGDAAREISYEANPHSSLLYYASAGGFPALFIVLALFASLLFAFRVGVKRAFPRGGGWFFLLIALSYLVIFLTVPYMLNSIILVVPAAILAGLASSASIRPAIPPRGAAVASGYLQLHRENL